MMGAWVRVAVAGWGVGGVLLQAGRGTVWSASTVPATSLPASRAVSAGVVVRTAHYDVYAERVDGAEVGRMLEAQHGLLEGFFGKAPEGRLGVEIYATEAGFHSALARDHQIVVTAGGYYAPGTRKAYLWVQPSEYYTRQLILHECAHQFHFLVATGNRRPELGMYSEGLAEQLAMHNWDGTHLQIGVIPALSLEDYPARALEHFAGPLKRNLAGMLSGEVAAERPEAWAFEHFLLDRYPAAFRAWAGALDHHATAARAAEALRSAAGADAAKLAAEFEPWLAGHQQPWEILANYWQEHGDAMEGYNPANRVGIALPKAVTTSLRVRCEVTEGPAIFGLVVNYKTADDYEILQVVGSGRVRLLGRERGAWANRGFWELPPRGPEGGNDVEEMSALTRGGRLVLAVDGTVLIELPGGGGRMGVHVQLGRVLFRVQ